MTVAQPRLMITGASGFLGSRLVGKFLSQGSSVVAVVRETSSLQQLEPFARHPGLEIAKLAPGYGNLEELFTGKEIDVVIHTSAAMDAGDDENAVRNLERSNILFPSLLLSAMKKRGIRYFINTGTGWQNADSPAYRPFNLYAATKQAFETILAHFVEDGLQAVTLRLFDTYGPNDPRTKILRLFDRSTATPTDFSGGEQQIDLVHIDDVCRAYAMAAELLLSGGVSSHGVFTVSGGHPITLRELAALFERVRNVRCLIDWGRKPYRPREIMKPTYAFESVPGWKPLIPLEAGLRNLY